MHLHQAGYVDAFPNFKQLSHNLLNVDFTRLSSYCFNTLSSTAEINC